MITFAYEGSELNLYFQTNIFYIKMYRKLIWVKVDRN